MTYTTAEYLDLLRTQSPFRLLGDARMEKVLAELGAVIDRHGGKLHAAPPHLAMPGVARLDAPGGGSGRRGQRTLGGPFRRHLTQLREHRLAGR